MLITQFHYIYTILYILHMYCIAEMYCIVFEVLGNQAEFRGNNGQHDIDLQSFRDLVGSVT